VSVSDVIKPRLFVVWVRTATDEVVVGVVLDVLVERHDVDVLQTDVNANSRLAVPEEISLLFDVSDIIGGLEMTRIV